MSIDSRNKRASMISLGLPFGRLMPDPDGSFSTAADRSQLAYQYAFAAAASTPITFNPSWVLEDTINSPWNDTE